jgi:hypothetical protein
MKIVQAKVITPGVHVIVLGVSIYVIEVIRSPGYIVFWAFW